MAKYIAHSSIDERGKISGGQAGDQTTREICIRTWYDKPFTQVLRIENNEVREQFANNMIDCANNDNIGYDQNQRNTVLTEAEKVGFDFSRIAVKCESDCSSLVTACVLGAIYKVLGQEAYLQAKSVLVVSGNCATTSSLKQRLQKVSCFNVSIYTEKEYVRSVSNAIYGDIYNKPGSHVVCYVDDAKKRVKNDGFSQEVQDWQNAAIADGFSFPKYGADGEWGAECESVAKKCVVKKRLLYYYPNATRIVQRKLGVKVDGKCGKNTKSAIMEYQRQNGLKVDGCVGLNTWKKMLGV